MAIVWGGEKMADPRIDPRVHHVGMTTLRTLSMDSLPEDEIYVLQGRGRPVAVLMPYQMFLEMQTAAASAKT
jgi:hypothetical protein